MFKGKGNVAQENCTGFLDFFEISPFIALREVWASFATAKA